ncbi:MAG: YeeE/YedE family protein [Burkholderiales bacterium]|nr:YeeE/YedE family protein [Burkholderiales bacterium]
MNKILFAFACGVLFAIGLVVAQMTNPAKVVGFLDVTGAWDPSLAFVMGGALTVFGFAYWSSQRKAAKPVLDDHFDAPPSRGITWELIAGSLLFGFGWGLSGFCPGPALVSAGFGDVRVWIFVVAMAGGVVAFNLTGSKAR